MYSYVLNNPLKYTDPTGEGFTPSDGDYEFLMNDRSFGGRNGSNSDMIPPTYYVDGVQVSSAFAGQP